MKKTKKNKYTQIVIRQKEGSQGLMSGGNTELFIDGKKMTSATKVNFEVAAAGVAKVTVELLGQVTIVGKIGQ
jgi:hypothetical protein